MAIFFTNGLVLGVIGELVIDKEKTLVVKDVVVVVFVELHQGATVITDILDSLWVGLGL